MIVYYKEISSGLIAAKYVNCDTQSTKFNDETKYLRFQSDDDLPIEIQVQVKVKPREPSKLEQLLISKGVFTKQELDAVMSSVDPVEK